MDQEAVAVKITSLETEVRNLKKWQAAQNGSIHEVRADVSKMKYWMMGATGMVALNLLGIVFVLLKGG